MVKINENQCTGMNKLGIPARWDGSSCSIDSTGSNLPIISGKELSLQVRLGTTELRPIIKREPGPFTPINKPSWGLWTSSLEEKDCLCDWQRWLKEELYIESFDKGMILEPKPDAKIIQIRNQENLRELHRRYPRDPIKFGFEKRKTIDWDKVAEDYDGVNLTKEGQSKTRNLLSDLSLYGWDCESTVWFKDVLEKKRDITADDLKCDIR